MYLYVSLGELPFIETEAIEKKKLEFTEYQQVLGCRIIDIVSITDDIAIVCDDEGLMKRDNPIFEVKNKNGVTFEIPGNFLFAKDKETEDGRVTVGFSTEEEMLALLSEINIRFSGWKTMPF